MVMETEGGTPVQLTTNGRSENPAWSPDGRYIAFVSRLGGKARVCVMNSNGTNVRVIHEGLDSYVSPTWSPHLNFY
jgi:Tol biopolymer transport system component